MAEESEGGLFREIEEELRQDKVNKIWKAYGKYIMGAAIAIVIGVAGHQGWRTYDTSVRTANGEKFAATARLIGGEPKDAIAAFTKIAGDVDSGYALLARFQAAGLQAQNGDTAGAIKSYNALANDNSLGPVYHDLAILLGALQELNDPAADNAALTSRLGPLTALANPWRFSARELLALVSINQGNMDKARELLTSNSTDPGSPTGVRERATEMLATLGN